jgi:Sugar (and other) transporter
LGEVTPAQRLALLLDVSPLNGIQRWLWVLSTGGTLLDGFAIFVLGVAMPLIIAVLHLTPDVVGLIGASLVLGAVFGAGLGGTIADHFGRKPLMLADMLIICAGAAASALAKGPAMLFIGQFVVGVGIGIDFPVSSSYVSEVLPRREGKQCNRFVPALRFPSWNLGGSTVRTHPYAGHRLRRHDLRHDPAHDRCSSIEFELAPSARVHRIHFV